MREIHTKTLNTILGIGESRVDHLDRGGLSSGCVLRTSGMARGESDDEPLPAYAPCGPARPMSVNGPRATRCRQPLVEQAPRAWRRRLISQTGAGDPREC